MDFDFAGARKAGATDEQIAEYLATNHAATFDFDGAFKAGATAEDVISYLEKANAPAEQPKGGITTDTGHLLKIGADQAAQDMRGVVGHIPVVGKPFVSAMDKLDEYIHGVTSDKLLERDIAEQQQKLTAPMQAAQAKDWWDSETKSFGPAISDPRSWYSGVVQSLPETAMTMVPALRMAKAAGVAAEAKALAAGATAAQAAASASKAASIAAYATGAISEGLLGGAQSERDVEKQIMDMQPELLAGSDAYQQLLAQGLSDAEARQQLATDAGTKAFILGGVATGIFSGAGDVFLSKAIRGEIGGGLASRMAKGAVSEGVLEEGPQGYLQQVAQNYATTDANPERSLTEGAMNQAVGGIATGGLMGVGFGVPGGAKAAPKPAPKPAHEVITEIQSAPDLDTAIQKAEASISDPSLDEDLSSLIPQDLAATEGEIPSMGQPLETTGVAAPETSPAPVAPPIQPTSAELDQAIQQTAQSVAAPVTGAVAKTDVDTGLIVTAAGEPYKTEKGAALAIKSKGTEFSATHQVVPHQGGFAIAKVENAIQHAQPDLGSVPATPLPDVGGTAQPVAGTADAADGSPAVAQRLDAGQPGGQADAAGAVPELGLAQPAAGVDQPAKSTEIPQKTEIASSNMAARIKQLGGIDIGAMRDITGESSQKNINQKGMFRNGGRSLDDLATMLAAEGFPIDAADVDGGVQQLRELVAEVSTGGTVLNYQAQEDAKAEEERKAHNEKMRLRARELGLKTAFKSASEVERMVAAAEEDLHKQVAKLDAWTMQACSELAADMEAEFGEEVYARFIEAANARTDNLATIYGRLVKYVVAQRKANEQRTASQAGQDDAGAAQAGDGAGRAPGGGQRNEESILESYTNAEVLKREAAAAKAEQEAAQEPATPKVNGDQVDLFNTQDSLFSSNREQTASASETLPATLDKDMPLFHGTRQGNKFSAFDVASTQNKGVGSNVFNQGHYAYLTQSREAAQWFADKATENADLRASKTPSDQPGEVLEFTLKKGAKVLRIENMPQQDKAAALIERAKADGVDAIMFRDSAFDAVEGSRRVADMLNSGEPMDTVLVLNHDMLSESSTSAAGNVKQAEQGAQSKSELDKVSAKFWKGETFREIAPKVVASRDVYTKKEPKFTGDTLGVEATDFDYYLTDGRRTQKINKEVFDYIESLKEETAQSAQSKKLEVLKAQAQGKITGDQGAALKELADAGEHAAVDEVLKPAAPEGDLVSKPLIGDFGEKLEGAKKDLWQTYRKAMSDELPADLKDITLSKHFPEPNYEGLIAAGTDIRAIAAIKAMRDEIPAKPHKSYKLQRWGEQLKTLREFSSEILNGSITADKVLEKMREVHALQGIADRIDLYAELGYPALKSAKGYEISGGWTRPGEKGEQFGLNTPERRVSFFATRQEAVDALRAKLATAPETKEGGRSTKLDIYRVTATGDIVIGKKLASNKYIDLKAGFNSGVEARNYLREHEQELLELLEKKKETPPERRSTNNPRIGKDHRLGEDVTPEKFAAEFGFRGVQFGNYVEQSKRGKDLNNAYDALLDMASTLNIPARAISLNGSLGLAFGARGSGGKNPAAAHFEPGNVVINLTKNNGAGSLGHEFFHALDNYFARMRGEADGHITSKPSTKMVAAGNKPVPDASIRPEVLDAFSKVMQAIKAAEFYKNSLRLDGRRTKDYWGTNEELAARAFEAYLIEKAQQRGEANDYLANVVDEEVWKAAEGLGLEDENTYPYPTRSDQEKLNPLFDALFHTLQTKETDKGMALYEPKRAYNENQLDLFGDPYDALETRPGTTEAQLDAGRDALAAVERRIFGNRAALPVRASVLGSAIASDFRDKGYTSLVGRQVNTSGDLALVAQILRDPRFETFRAFYVKDGKIVGERAYTSRMAGQVSLSPEIAEHIGADMQRTEADGYWLLHNHPSGRATASQSDLRLTEMIAGNARGMLGHVIIDHNEYNNIEVFSKGIAGLTAVEEVIKTDLGAIAAQPEVEHALLGFSLNSPKEAAAIAKHLQKTGVYSSIVGRNSKGDVVMVLDVPALTDANAMNRLKAAAMIRRAARETGSTEVFAIVPGDLENARHLMKHDGLFRDVISADTGASAVERGMMSSNEIGGTKAQKRGMLAYVAEPAWHGSPYDHDKFDMSKVGTGEGAQAYGHGLYFAGSKDVAEWYRDKLSGSDLSSAVFSKDGVTLRGDEILPEYFKPGRIVNGYGGQDEVIEFRKDSPYEGVWSVKVVDTKDPARFGKQYPRWHSTRPSANEVKKVLESEGWSVLKGRLYQVELAPAPDEYLLWDKPLSEQSEKVKAALASVSLPSKGMTGQEIYSYMKEVAADKSGETGTSPSFYKKFDKAASEYLHSIGIRGIKYLDGSSRPTTITDKRLISLFESNSNDIEKTVAEYMRTIHNTPAEKAKIEKNIRAQLGKGLNYNYVIFNDEDVEIKAKFSRSKRTGGQTVESVKQATKSLRARWLGFRKIDIVQSADELPANLREWGMQSGGLDGLEGLFDPKTKTVYLIADNLASPEHAVWVAAHEVVGHGGIRMLGKPVADALEYAGRNSYVKKLARAIADDRGETFNERIHTDEAIAELSAATITDRPDVILNRYGIEVPRAMRNNLLGTIKRVIDAVRAFMARVLGKEEVSDGDILGLIRTMQEKVEGGDEVYAAGGYAMASRDSLDFTKAQAQSSINEANYEQGRTTPEGLRPGRQGKNLRTVGGGIPRQGWAEGTRIARGGEPFTVHRGAALQLESGHFEQSALGRSTGHPSSGLGVWFTSHRSEAVKYGNVESFKLDIRNPAIIKADELPGDLHSVEDYYALREEYRAKGNDGLVIHAKHLGKPEIHFVAFDPYQVVYPEEMPLASRQGSLAMQGGAVGNAASWNAPAPSRLDNFIYQLQDKHIDLKRVSQAIRDTGKDIADSVNAYLQEELYHGRAATKTQEFLENELNPLITDMRMRSVKMADLEEYLWMRHAEERNAQIAKVNPDMPDGGSGISTQEAKDYLAGLPEGKRKSYEALAKRVDAINAKTRQTWVDYKIESPDSVKAMESAYQHYVPLMREDFEGHGMGTGQGFSVRGNSTKRATGSNRAVVDILANIAMQREKAITRGEKNRVAKALIGLAYMNPNGDFWKVNKPPVIRAVNERTGLVEERIDPSYKSRDNVVMARDVVNGKVVEYSLAFNEHDERAMRMAQSFKSLDQDQIGEWLGRMGHVTRYFAAINTQYNPMFGVINIMRDTFSGALNLSTTPLKGKEAKIMKDTPSALLGIYADIRGHRKGKAASSKWAALYEEFRAEGGQTGYRDQYRNSKDRAEAIEQALDPDWWLNTKAGKVLSAGGVLEMPERLLADKAIRPTFEWLSDYNEAMENAVRLSAYKEARDMGLSKQQAASLAKNLTVNFNRGGVNKARAGALYAFFNASVQGTARMAATLKGPRGKQIIAGGIMLGVLEAAAMAMAGFDDDEPPEFVKDRNIIIPTGDGQYLTIPMPLGFNVLPVIGRSVAEAFFYGKPMDRALHIGEVALDMFNPIGTASIIQTLSPTVIDPVAALAENKDWRGAPIAREDFNSLAPTPGFARAKDTSTAIGRLLSEGINLLTGGTEYQPGKLSPTPDQLDYLAAQIGGGVWRETSKIWQSGESAMTGQEMPWYKVPLAGKFFGDTTEQSAQGAKFYANLERLNKLEAEVKGRRKDHIETASVFAASPEARLVNLANAIERDVQELRRMRRKLIEQDASKDKIKLLDDRITNRMRKLNERVEAVTQ